jgi:zinc transport system ATP-binding protein
MEITFDGQVALVTGAAAGIGLATAQAFAETGAAVLMVSHDLHVVMSASDRVICLNGHVCCQGTPKVVAEAPEYRALFGMGTQGAFALYQHDHDHGDEHTDHATCTHEHAHV